MKYFNQEEICAKFKKHIRLNYESQTEAAEMYGSKANQVSMACGNKQAPNSVMLADLGFERVVRYVKTK